MRDILSSLYRLPFPIPQLLDLILPLILKGMGLTYRLNATEERVLGQYLKTLMAGSAAAEGKLKIVGMVGLVGSGKSTVATMLAVLMGARVIESDTIRVLLRKEGAPYERRDGGVLGITYHAMVAVLRSGASVILDADHTDPTKRASLNEYAKRLKAKTYFVRIQADIDQMIGRSIRAEHLETNEDFFGGATSSWNLERRGNVVKIREMLRRLPHHYRFVNRVGGQWVLRALPFRVFSTIDTGHAGWQRDVEKVAKRLNKR